MSEETLNIKHGEMLVEVTGMKLGDIWQHLINFVLWGEPDKEKEFRQYLLFWSWKAIVMLQAGEKMPSDGWSDPFSIVGQILGWDYKKVIDSCPRSGQPVVTYSEDTFLAQAIYETVTKYIDQSDVEYAEDDSKKPALEPGKWYWNIQADCPAFLRSYVNGAPRVLMPIVQTDDGPSMDNDDILYTLTSFNDVIVDYGALRKVNLMAEKLPY